MRKSKLYMLSMLHHLDFCHKVNLSKPYCLYTENRDMKMKTLLSKSNEFLEVHVYRYFRKSL